MKTLLTLRRKQRDEAIEDLVDGSRVLAKCVEIGGSSSERKRITSMLEEYAMRAAFFSQIVADLEDVETYGPGGGR